MPRLLLKVNDFLGPPVVQKQCLKMHCLHVVLKESMIVSCCNCRNRLSLCEGGNEQQGAYHTAMKGG